MTVRRVIGLLVVCAVAGLVLWVAANTEFTTTEVPLPLRGDARRNPFYAAERLAGALGARATWGHRLGALPPDGVAVVSGLHWTLIPARREAIETWVESGGRLVVDQQVLGFDAFNSWSGVSLEYPEADEEDGEQLPGISGIEDENLPRCRPVQDPDGRARFEMCGVPFGLLESSRVPEWTLRDGRGLQGVRVGVGRGSVTVINATPFTFRNLLEKDHGRLFVAAAELRAGDTVRFISENEAPSLLSLIWTEGAPVVILAAALIGLALWRGGIRFGPLSPPPPLARRSLGEQIRGSGRFALRNGGGEALHAATVRALEEAAARRIPGFRTMTVNARTAAVATLTKADPVALASAITPTDVRRPADLRHAIARLETVRRQLLHGGTGEMHGTD